MFNMHSFISRRSRFPILQRTALVLVALACGNFAFGGEIHDAASHGDLEKVRALLKENRDLVFSEDGE